MYFHVVNKDETYNQLMRNIKLCVIIVLSAIVLSACGDSSNEDDSRGNNIIEGTWLNYFEDTDSLVMVRVFTFDYYSFFSYAEGKRQDKLNNSSYSIDSNRIYLSGYTQSYKLVGDTLRITNSKGDQTTKYIRAKVIDYTY